MNTSLGLGKNHSTSQAVMEVLDNIYQHCNSQEANIGIMEYTCICKKHLIWLITQLSLKL